MSVTANRVDESAPLLRELRDAANKGATGYVSASGPASEVRVYLDAGQVYAVHSPQFTFPVEQLVADRTGGPAPDGVHPLAHLSQSGVLGDPNESLDVIERIILDWSYGLLASALTWTGAKVKFHSQRKAEANGPKFLPKAWQIVIQDVTSRVDDLTSSWDVITRDLVARGMAPRAASYACDILVASVPGDPLLDGRRPVDEIAWATGSTRSTVLGRIASAIIEGRPIDFHPSGPTVELPQACVPESLEDPQAEWAPASTAADLPQPEPVAADAVEEVVADDLTDELDALPDFVEQPQPYAEPEAADDLEDALADPEPQPDPEPVVDPEPDAYDVLNATDGYEEPAGLPVTYESVQAGNPLHAWVQGAPQGVDHDLRQAVVDHAAQAAAQQAQDHLEALRSAVDAYDVARNDLTTASEQAQRAREREAAAAAQLEEATRQLDAVRTAGQAVIAQRDEVAGRAQGADLAAQAARDGVAAARRALDEAVAREAQAAADAKEARAALEAAEADVEREVGEPLRAAEANVDHTRDDVLEPARKQAQDLADGLRMVQESVAAAEEHVMASGSLAERAVGVLATIEAPEVTRSQPLMDQLRALHGRVQELSGGEVDPQPQTVPSITELSVPQVPFEAYPGEPDGLDHPVEEVVPSPEPALPSEQDVQPFVALPEPAPVDQAVPFTPASVDDTQDDADEDDGMVPFDQVVSGDLGAVEPWSSGQAVPWQPVAGAE